MNSNKKIIIMLLLMMPWGASSARTDDRPCDDIHMKKGICNVCPNLQAELGDREHTEMPLRNTNSRRGTDRKCELLEDIDKRDACRREQQDQQDQQADILEKLLLEKTSPVVNPAGP